MHLEVCHSLDTDNCLLAIRRFVSRRGYSEIIISEKGTNFTASKKVMNCDNITIDKSYIAQLIAAKHCLEEEFTTCSTLRRCMGNINSNSEENSSHILGSQQLKVETFKTFVTETEGIPNSRPKAYVSSDNNDEEALTPNHFILRRPHLALAPLTAKLKTFRKKNFNYTQTLLHHFWKSLQREYTSDIISRANWRELRQEVFGPSDG